MKNVQNQIISANTLKTILILLLTFLYKKLYMVILIIHYDSKSNTRKNMKLYKKLIISCTKSPNKSTKKQKKFNLNYHPT